MAHPPSTNPNPDDIQLAYASLAVFADDGTLDSAELESLLHLALRDGKIDDSETEILRNLFNRIREEDVDGDVWDRILAVRKQHGI